MKDTMSDNRGVNLIYEYAKGMRVVHESYKQYEIQSDTRNYGLKKKDINCEKLLP
jgi:hypothetical protein